LPVAAARFRFGALLLAELRMLLKGLPWWWLAVAAGLITASVFSPLEIVRRGLLPAAWIWPILLWSSLGSREARHDTRQMVFSAPHPLGRQLPAAWLAGFVLAVLMGAGAAVKLSLAGDVPGLISLLAGALFVPSLALALGVWTGSSKAFEIIYTLWWYAGPMNGLLALDYIGVNTREVWPFYMLMSAILCIGAVIGRERQLRNL
jgi:hypothetical protein